MSAERSGLYWQMLRAHFLAGAVTATVFAAVLSPMMDQKQSPPFVRYIDRADDLVFIRCGEGAWTLARPDDERVASLVFPRRADPTSYRWPVSGKYVIVFASGEIQAVTDPLVMELLHQGAYCVGVYADGELTEYDLRAWRP